MYKNLATVGISIALLLSPVLVSADSLNDLEARLQSLLVQLASLNQQIALLDASSSATSTISVPAAAPAPAASATAQCIALTHSLTFGDTDARTGGEVSFLQHYLSGALADFPTDNVTGRFGPLTLAALKEWQSAQGIVSGGDANSTGWGVVGPKTRAALARGCAAPASATPPSVRSASINLSVIAPLSTSITVEVNTKGSCAAQTYVLDYGDGSPKETIAVAGGLCAPVSKTFAHSYAASGTHTAAVTSGSLSVPLTFSLQPPQSTSDAQTSTSSPVALSCTPPSFPLPVVQPLAIGNSISAAVLSYTDTPDSPITVSATGTPPGMRFVDQPYQAAGATSTSHLWSLVGAPNALGTYQLTVNADNSCSGTQTLVQVVVTNQNVVNCPVYQQPICSAGQTLSYRGTDSSGCSMGYICH